MSRRLIGTLTDPSGTPLAGWLLTLDARRNAAPSVPIGASESVVLDVSGGYDLLITDGLYMALLTAPGDTIQRRIGLFLVAPGTDIDILTLITLYSSATYPGPNPLAIEDEGVQLVAAATRLNFTGAGVVATALGNSVTVAIDSGGGGGAGDVVGPASAVAGNLPSFADATGKLLADSGVTPGALVPNTRTVNGFPLSANITLSAGDVGADSSGAASAAVSAHEGAANPHPVDALDTDLSAYLPKSLVDVKGDLLVATAADTVARKAAGTNGTFLKADSAQADGLQWAALTDTDIPAAIARDTEVTAAVAAHVAAADPHPVYATDADLSGHTGNVSNPHGVTKAQVGLGSADNTSDSSKPVSTAQQTALDLKQDTSGKDASGGYAGLTLFKLNLRNAANTLTSFFTTAATVARTWTLPDKDGTIAMLADASYLGAFTFSTIPAASGNARKLATLTDSAFGYGVLVQSDGTRWRPVGEQVLSSGPASAITVQSLSELAAVVIGPFPGGLVKTGDTLSMHILGVMRGVGTGSRSVFMRAGAAGTIADEVAFRVLGGTSITASTGGDFSAMPILFVTNDTSGTHSINNRFSAFNETGLYSPTVASAIIPPTIDFSAPWYVTLSGQSFPETAVNITSSSWSGGVATHVSTAHTLNTGDKTVIAGSSLAGYNGTFSPVTRIDANTFSVPLAADPGGAGTGGTTSRVSNIILQRYRLMWSS